MNETTVKPRRKKDPNAEPRERVSRREALARRLDTLADDCYPLLVKRGGDNAQLDTDLAVLTKLATQLRADA